MILHENLTFYDILEISSTATPSEIRGAYLRIKSTFNRDSVALYSIMGTEEQEETLQKIEEAYRTLSDPEKRRAYDLSYGFLSPQEETFVPTVAPLTPAIVISIDRVPPMETLEDSDTFLLSPSTDFTAPTHPPLPAKIVPSGPPPMPAMKRSRENTNPSDSHIESYAKFRGPLAPMPTLDPTLYQAIELETEWRGSFLKKVRESYRISIEEMTGITKVTKTYLVALEEENYLRLPAAVYVRGFITQIAKVLKLPHEKVANAYLDRYHRSQKSA